MPRIRSIKPELARHEPLFNLERDTGLPIRFTWALLPTICDREGRFKWRPRDLKLDLLPYDDCDFSRVLDALLTCGQVVKYRVARDWYGWIPTFLKHQHINNKEPPSSLPSLDVAEEVEDHTNHELTGPPSTREKRVDDASTTREGRESGEASLEGKGREGKGRRKDASSTREPALHESLPITEWEEWLSKRRLKRWPMDELTLRKQLALLAEYDTATQREILNTTMQAGWQGVFAPKSNGRAKHEVGGQRQAAPPLITHVERERRDLDGLKTRRAGIGLADFRDPLPNETAAEYRKAQDDEHGRRREVNRERMSVIAGATKGMP